MKQRILPKNGRGRRPACVGLVVLALLLLIPAGWSQHYPGWQPPAPIGPTPGATLRNAISATLTQAGSARQTASAWSRRAKAGNYRADQFQQDLYNMQSQSQALRLQFDWLASLTSQPRARNVVAELDAGLNIIAELFTFLQQQQAAGALDRHTVARTARAFEDTLGQWERELRQNSAQLGMAW